MKKIILGVIFVAVGIVLVVNRTSRVPETFGPETVGVAGAQPGPLSKSTTPLHAILAGAQAAATPAKPTQPEMPAYAWKLTDYEIASVATGTLDGLD